MKIENNKKWLQKYCPFWRNQSGNILQKKCFLICELYEVFNKIQFI